MEPSIIESIEIYSWCSISFLMPRFCSLVNSAEIFRRFVLLMNCLIIPRKWLLLFLVMLFALSSILCHYYNHSGFLVFSNSSIYNLFCLLTF